MEVDVTPDFYIYFKILKLCRVSNLAFHHIREKNEKFSSILKNIKKRIHFEIEDDKRDYEELKKMSTEKDEAIENLKSQINQFEHERIELLMNSEKLENYI